MNLAAPAQSIDDSEARYLQDALVDLPGLTRRRGPIHEATGITSVDHPATGILGCTNPVGDFILGVLNGTSGNGYLSAYTSDQSAKVDLPWEFGLPNSPIYAYDAKPMLLGGALIGVTDSYLSDAAHQGLAVWRGGNKADYSTGTVSVTRGSASVTGSGTTFSSNVSPGMFLFADTTDPFSDVLIGTVKSVDSNTTLTLEKVSPFNVSAGSYTLKSLRGLAPKVAKGRVTTDTSTTNVTGATTKFSSQGLGTGTWLMYRASDDAFIGKVSSVPSETSIVLAANAAVACSNERFYALRTDANYDVNTLSNLQKVGFLNAVFAERQWYANNGSTQDKTQQLWFSEPTDPEALDLSPFDGDFLPVPSSTGVSEPVYALMPCSNSLAVIKEKEAFAVFGTSPSTFSLRKIEDDGTLSAMSVVPYGGGTLWAGRKGIHYFDGIQVQNIIIDKLGDFWKNLIVDFDPTTKRMWATEYRDHYFLFIESVTPDTPVVKGASSSTQSRMTVVVNLASRAVTVFTNMDLLGGVQFPANAGNKHYFLVNDSSAGVICDTSFIFDQTGVDDFACASNTAGPDFYFESKKFYAADALRKKLFKIFSMHYLVSGGNVKLDTVVGLNNVGQTSLSVFEAGGFSWHTLGTTFTSWDDLAATYPTWDDILNAFYIAKRIKFQKRGQFLSVRLYQSTNAITKLVMGPYALFYKFQRLGKV
jgi:hypothetical protein